MLRSLILQMIKQDEAAFQDIREYYPANKAFSASFSASSHEMQVMLYRMVQNRNFSYLVIDGLDECQDLNVLMTLLSDFETAFDQHEHRNHRWLVGSQNTLAVSQNLPANHVTVSMDKDRVNADIKSYILSRLESDPQLCNYSIERQTLMSKALTSKSHGMYVRHYLHFATIFRFSSTDRMRQISLGCVPIGPHALTTRPAAGQCQAHPSIPPTHTRPNIL